jgi:hypothetical protein
VGSQDTRQLQMAVLLRNDIQREKLLAVTVRFIPGIQFLTLAGCCSSSDIVSIHVPSDGLSELSKTAQHVDAVGRGRRRAAAYQVRFEVFKSMHHVGMSLLTSSSCLHVLWHRLRQYLVVVVRVCIAPGDVDLLVACGR